MYVVVFLPRPFFLLHTVQSVCLFFLADVQGRLAGKWHSVSLDRDGGGRCSRPWLKGASSLMSTTPGEAFPWPAQSRIAHE